MGANTTQVIANAMAAALERPIPAEQIQLPPKGARGCTARANDTPEMTEHVVHIAAALDKPTLAEHIHLPRATRPGKLASETLASSEGVRK